jgi:hypothetical protein
MSDALNPEAHVEATPEGIGEFIVMRARELWQEKKSPLLLSKIDPELKLHGINYKDILPQGTSLRQFVSTLDNKLRIVVHPIHKAKIGVVPHDSTFVFEAEPTVKPGPAIERQKKIRQPNQRFIVMQFLTALSRLNEEERNSVVIPVQILARLMEEK